MYGLIALFGLAAYVTAVTGASVDKGCSVLAAKYPGSTFFPNTSRYDYENECKLEPAVSPASLSVVNK